MDLRPVVRRSVTDAVFEQLSAAIIEGELAPGEALPAERALTDRLGVNRQAVREALKRLEQAGLVQTQHGGGTRINDYRRNGGLDLLPRLLVGADGTIDVAVARSIMELRDAIGRDVAQRCAERAVPVIVNELHAAVEAMARTDDLEELSRLDHAFWDLLVEGSDNIAYRLAYNGLRASYEPLEPLMRPVLADELRDVAGRRAVVRAVSAGDGRRAAAAARRHLARGTAALTAALAAAMGR